MGLGLSVAIPTHDRRETVVLAVRSALAQTRAPVEVIVICDGCTDGTREAMAALGERVVAMDRPKAAGYGYAHRTEALRLARGEAIAWLGDDDLWLPDHLERLGALLDGGAELAQAMSVAIAPDDSMFPLAYDWRFAEPRRLLLEEGRTFCAMGTIAHRVDRALEVGGWNADLARGGDADLWRRLVTAGARTAMAGVPTVLNFTATGRRQDWRDRVAQNARWLARTEDAASLAELRADLDRELRRVDAERVEWIAYLRSELADAEARAATATEELAARHAEVDALHAELARVNGVLGGVLRSRWWRVRSRLRR